MGSAEVGQGANEGFERITCHSWRRLNSARSDADLGKDQLCAHLAAPVVSEAEACLFWCVCCVCVSVHWVCGSFFFLFFLPCFGTGLVFEHYEVRQLQADACVKEEAWLRSRLEGLEKSDMRTICVQLNVTRRDGRGSWLPLPTLVENVVAHFHPRTVACLRC